VFEPWLKRITIISLSLLCLYVIGGFLGVPLALRHIALAKVNDKINGNLEVERFRFNPFTYELKIENFKGKTSEGQVVTSFAQFRFKLKLTSLFSDRYIVPLLILDQPNCNLHISQFGQTNLATLFKSKKPSPTQNRDASFTIPNLSIEQLEVRNAGLRLCIDTGDNSFKRDVKNISFEVKDFNTDASQDNPYRLSLSTNKDEQLEVTGSIRLDPLSSVGSVSLKSLKLADFTTFLSMAINAEVTSGNLNVFFDYLFRPLAKEPQLGIAQGELSLEKFCLATSVDNQATHRINALHMDGFFFDLVGQSMHIDSLHIDGASSLLVRDNKGEITLIQKANPQQANHKSPINHPEYNEKNKRHKHVQTRVIAAGKDIGEVINKTIKLTQKLGRNNNDTTTNQNPIAINLNECVISNGEFIIHDKSVQPAVKLGVKDITMTMGPYISPEEHPLELNLAMTLAGNTSGSIQLKGSTLPAKPFKSTHLELTANNVSMPCFAGYSVAALGYAPTDGGIKAQLECHINNGLIEGSSGLEIEQMQFGPRIQGSDAPHLPLKLAIAILKDSNGMVTLDIPVSGDINHPKFSYGNMVTYAIHNVITKIATAPLSVLSGIFPDGDGVEQDFIEFEAGQASLPKGAAGMLTKLAKIMEARPGLTAQLSPSFALKEDTEALGELLFEQSIAALIAEGEDRNSAIKKLHKSLSKKERAPGFLPDHKEMEAADHKSFHVTQADLLKLAEDRARTLRELLLTQSGINASRIEINAPAESTSTRVRIAFDVAKN